MNEKNITTQIDRIFWPTWLMVSQLRNGQAIDDGEAVYRRACGWVDKVRQELAEAGFSEASIEQMIYTQCALLDESVLNRKQHDSGSEKWLSSPLQAKYFNTLNAGEELWERIKVQLRSPAPDIAALTCFYRALALGFVGRYREQGDERREDVVQALSQQVPPFAMTTDIPIIAAPAKKGTGRTRWWFGWIGGVIILAALWFFLSSTLQDLVSQLTGMA
ncbi:MULTISPECIES: type VI secretion system protein TssL, short form [Tenebrionibacter/Tenebrionicola group]|jgi:type VI secretion system protein ImpK|uniref:Type VI secretion system protein TssL, short form n=2 Tax=Tenebrionibacter/Tenebrionicola group TaxID=2969848 RepID=A0A8K0V2D3_9ENTR|nr:MULTISPECIES: type VI secretion system protein TssL, short form [Tenebrionibacter/Tenebrionicola group]MBK4714276.1 type VI secretion system protein TssL, short form [Tenebrionibacter intestinalis]MBV4413428.1 type VI secretion system protein TssL, short form [Tenebrionicola larvae]MBV5094313.1 type VI secretion system protein TssL, short form [Tenebrionicola larvae]